MSKEQILDELRRVAAELGRTPGKGTFESATGLRESDWSGRYWVRWSEVVAEAGLTSNAMQQKIPVTDLAALLAAEARRLGHFPTSAELKMRRIQDPSFPNPKTFQSHGGRFGMIQMLQVFCDASQEDWSDVLDMLPAVDEAGMDSTSPVPKLVLGSVYLVRSGKRYKIGFSTDVQRRLLQLNTGMPDTGELIHIISTDDPAGIESYWHRRFAAKRVRPDAEWFDLNSSDIQAFRRRKFQ